MFIQISRLVQLPLLSFSVPLGNVQQILEHGANHSENYNKCGFDHFNKPIRNNTTQEEVQNKLQQFR